MGMTSETRGRSVGGVDVMQIKIRWVKETSSQRYIHSTLVWHGITICYELKNEFFQFIGMVFTIESPWSAETAVIHIGPEL